jgi:hypothetical protein
MRKHLLKIAFAFLWLAAIFIHKELIAFGVASLISAASLAIYRCNTDEDGDWTN